MTPFPWNIVMILVIACELFILYRISKEYERQLDEQEERERKLRQVD